MEMREHLAIGLGVFLKTQFQNLKENKNISGGMLLHWQNEKLVHHM